MLDVDFSLKRRDKLRYFKDRFARLLVKCGGAAVFAAILVIFGYLVTIVLPIFYGAQIDWVSDYVFETEQEVVDLRIGDDGKSAQLFTRSGQLLYIRFEDGKAIPVLTTQVMAKPVAFAKSAQSQGWFGYANQRGEIVALKPGFELPFTESDRYPAPEPQLFNSHSPIVLSHALDAIEQFAFTIRDNHALFVAQTESGEFSALQMKAKTEWQSGQMAWVSSRVTLPRLPEDVDQMEVSPDGRQLFILSGNELILAHLEADKFVIRERVDLSQGNADKSVRHIRLLSGASSMLVTHKDNTVSQWFDVLKGGERLLTRIREFETAGQNRFILTDTYRKGFYSFADNGIMQGFYTTNQDVLFSDPLYSAAPHMAAISDNENFLMALLDNKIALHRIKNPHPEVSFSSLWRKIWYESYPEPQYVWQSGAANNHFEAKFSLVLITFGTLKATFFAMLFAVPIAVSGAIYTAYFMSSPMRKVVKPAIEIMEALPTVIIGFLAGLWLAPIVETHLTGVVMLFLALPCAAIFMSIVWGLLPKKIARQLPDGWHVIALIPVIILTGYLCVTFSATIEAWWFGGDIRLYLAELGINYDQRNALIVGAAMGFAVIPTIFTIAEDAIFSVPKHLSDGSLALGATSWQTLIYVVLLTASPGIFSAIMIGLGRAVGETMIVLMATGNTPVMDFNIFEGMRSLSATIAMEMPESEVGDSHYRILFLAALVLFIFTFVVNSLAEIVRQALKARYSSM